jgi:predicted nucleic acid-binding protein
MSGETLAVPHLVDIEVASTYRALVRANKLTPQAAERALTALATFPAQRTPHSGLLGRIWALRNNLTAHDATYVALAELLGATLLTADARIAAAPGLQCPVEVTRTG